MTHTTRSRLLGLLITATLAPTAAAQPTRLWDKLGLGSPLAPTDLRDLLASPPDADMLKALATVNNPSLAPAGFTILNERLRTPFLDGSAAQAARTIAVGNVLADTRPAFGGLPALSFAGPRVIAPPPRPTGTSPFPAAGAALDGGKEGTGTEPPPPGPGPRAPFSSLNNLVIYRVGSSGAATASAVFLDEYTPAGALVQSIALPSSGATALTARGNSTTEGILGRSADGRFLLVPGYRADAGAADPSAATAAAVNRVVGRVDAAGNADTSTALTDAFSGASIRSAASADGSQIYAIGDGGVRLTTFGTTGTSTSINGSNLRGGRIVGDALYVATGSTTGTFARGVGVFSPLPTAAATPAAVVTQAAGASNQFILLDRSPAVPGVDTLYVADLGSGQVDKYSLEGSTWTPRGSLALTGATGIAGTGTAASANLFITTATTTTSTLQTLTDTAAFNADIAGAFTTIATAPAGSSFRGVEFAPVPEPGTVLGLAALGLAAARLVRRRRAAV